MSLHFFQSLHIAALAMILGFGASVSADENWKSALPLAPEALRGDLQANWERAGDRATVWSGLLERTVAEQRAGMAFLLAYMPVADMKTLTPEWIAKNVSLAYQARAAVPWGAALPEELFWNDVLPYASLSEAREDWREEFFAKFLPQVRTCKTPGEAVTVLNQAVFESYQVKYHPTQRRAPDQGPQETIRRKVASCTGLSILLIDACRAVGIPARAVGTPRWSNLSGNHTWVEVWDGSWHFLGACERSALDQTWFVANARDALADVPEHAIYASSYRPTGLTFPMVWALDRDDVPAVNVTPFYQSRADVSLDLADFPSARHWTIRWSGLLIAHGTSPTLPASKILKICNLPIDQEYEVTIGTDTPKTLKHTFRLDAKPDNRTIRITDKP